ncbi:MAG: helix-hairpin-helix domain-containing protein [Anaerolinea sp.]|nr:helix-hairpin-helix domain-containing protein [Anaerolinea sp.]
MDERPQSLLPVVIFAGMFLVIAGAISILLANQPAPVQITILPPPATATPIPSATPGPLLIYVTGAVGAPASTVSLPAGSRVEDAIRAAGGLTEDADLVRVNLAAVLSDGDQVHVPRIGEAGQDLATPGRAALRIGINTTTASELERLPGIGPSLAAAIVAYREANGPFQSLEDLDAVPGIGPALLAQIAEYILFD